MPVYCYRTTDGKLHEVVMTVSEMLRRSGKDLSIKLPDGRRAERSIADEHRGFRNTPGNWPLACEAMAIHPDQIPEAVESCRAMGIPTDYTPTGEPILRDRNHRKKYARAIGLIDRDGGYGDP